MNDIVKKPFAQQFFSYNAVFQNVVSGASPIYTLTIQADSDFEVQKLTGVVLYNFTSPDTATTLAVPAVSVMINDAGTANPWMDQPVPVYSLFGSGQLPFVLPNPKLIRRTKQLVIQLYNNFTAQDLRYVALSFIGRRLYDNKVES